MTRENSELRTKLSNCEQNLRQATDMLEKEIARERSLRRLLDAQRTVRTLSASLPSSPSATLKRPWKAATKGKTEAA